VDGRDLNRRKGVICPGCKHPMGMNKHGIAWHPPSICQENLRRIIKDFEATYKKVIEETCSSDEIHCVCVPFLRMRIEMLEGLLRKAQKVLKRKRLVPPRYIEWLASLSTDQQDMDPEIAKTLDKNFWDLL
jgi:hypothetical protein